MDARAPTDRHIARFRPRRRRAGTAALLGVLATAMVAAEPGSAAAAWLTRAPMQEARQEVGVAVLEGRVYVAGGFRQDRSSAPTVEAYDIATDRWQFVASLPVGLDHVAAAALGGKLYVLGGFQGGSAVDLTLEYDPAADQWVSRAPMPTPRGALAAAVIQGKLYAVGGARGGASVGDLAAYDPVLDRWDVLPPMPTPRDHLGAGAIEGRLYAVGGRNQVTFTVGTVEAFDAGDRTWVSRAPMPTPRSGIAVAVVGPRLYAFGGEGNARDPRGIFPEVESFDPASDAWTRHPPMPTPRHGIGAGVHDADIHIPGGATVEAFGTTAVHDLFTLEPTRISVMLGGCEVCAPGDRFAVDARVSNRTSAPLLLEVKFGVRTPDGTPRAVLATRQFEAVLLPGEFGPLRVLDLPLPPGLPAGRWQVEAALLEPELGETIARDARPFTIVP